MKKQNNKKIAKGQTIIELSFCVLVLFTMVYGLIHVFQWAGTDQAMRLKMHEQMMSQNALGPTRFSTPAGSGVLQQIEPNFYRPEGMNTIFKEAL